MEAMAAAMAVTLVLTAFIGAAAIFATETEIEKRDLNIDDLADLIRIRDGVLEGDLQNELSSQLDLKSIKGASIRCTPVPGPEGDPMFEGELYFFAGTQDGNMSVERRLYSVDTEGGTALVNLEVRIWN